MLPFLLEEKKAGLDCKQDLLLSRLLRGEQYVFLSLSSDLDIPCHIKFNNSYLLIDFVFENVILHSSVIVQYFHSFYNASTDVISNSLPLYKITNSTSGLIKIYSKKYLTASPGF